MLNSANWTRATKIIKKKSQEVQGPQHAEHLLALNWLPFQALSFSTRLVSDATKSSLKPASQWRCALTLKCWDIWCGLHLWVTDVPGLVLFRVQHSASSLLPDQQRTVQGQYDLQETMRYLLSQSHCTSTTTWWGIILKPVCYLSPTVICPILDLKFQNFCIESSRSVIASKTRETLIFEHQHAYLHVPIYSPHSVCCLQWQATTPILSHCLSVCSVTMMFTTIFACPSQN